MSFSISKRFRSGTLVALLGLACSPVAVNAANLLTITGTNPFALTCGATGSGPNGGATISVKAATAPSGSNTIAVTLVAPPGLTVSPSSAQSIAAANTPVVYTLTATTGCTGLTPGSNSMTLQFKANNVNDATATGTIVASLLQVSPTTLAVTCSTDGANHYSVGTPQTVSVYGSGAGVPLTSVSGTTGLTLNPSSPSSASVGTSLSTAYTFTVAAAAPSSGPCPTTPTTMNLVSGTISPNKTVQVTFQTLPWSPLAASPAAPTMSYIRNSGTPATQTVTISSTKVPNAFFNVDTTTLPSWLTVDQISGVVTGGMALHFSTTSLADVLNPGTSNTAAVHLKVSGYGDFVVPFTLNVSDPSATLSVEEGITRNLTWAVNTPLPTPVITAVSSGSPIAYTVSTVAGTVGPQVAATAASGLAYNFGTAIPVTFSPAYFASAQPGKILTGQVILTGGGKTITVTFNVTVTFTSATATATSVSPATLPTAAIGQTFTVTLYGTGFVPSTDPTQQTVAGLVNTTASPINNIPAGAIGADPNVVATVVNASTIVFSITVPASDGMLPFFTGTPKTLTLGVCNPNGSANGCTSPTGTKAVTIAAGPTFSAGQVLSSSTFQPVTSVSPYDILSIFGANFCTSNGTGCAPGQVLYGVVGGANLAYQTTVTPDAAGNGSAPRQLSVTFTNHSTPANTVNAPILFATNNQINILVPSVISGWTVANGIDLTVSFGGLTSTAVNLALGTTDPGILTVNSEGSGDGAILDANNNLVGNTNPALMRASGSDTIVVYATGLGAPKASEITSYLGNLTSAPATMDGLLLSGTPIPTLQTKPTVMVGAATVPGGNVTYSGWVSGSVAGLYQVNVVLPDNSGSFTDSSAHTRALAAPAQFPIKVGASQSNVSVWVLPQITLTAPTPLTAPASDSSWTAGNPLAATGSSPAFNIPAYTLPTSMTIDGTSGAITAAPTVAGSWVVTATATDTSTPPVSGSLNFLVKVGSPTVSMALATDAASNPLIRPSTYGVPNANVATVVATGGTAPYVYSLTSPSSLPSGISIDASTGVVSAYGLVAGVYEVGVTATDSAGTPNTGTINFPLKVNPAMGSTAGEFVIGSAGVVNSALTTVSAATGNPGSAITYTKVNFPAWMNLDASTGVISTTSAAVAGTFYVGVTATDGTTPTHGAAGGVNTIYLAVTIQ